MKPQHTPPPWQMEIDTELVYVLGKSKSGETEVICEAGSIGNQDLQAQANAALIVRAVNCHDDLIKTVEALQTALYRQSGFVTQIKDEKLVSDSIQLLKRAKGEV
jgi:hypothetical protein